MFEKRRCPHTGVVNLYSDGDPYLAVGSLVPAQESEGVYWRCYAFTEPVHGLATDARTAERRLMRQIQKASANSDNRRNCAA